MKKIVEHLYVGTIEDIKLAEQQGFSVLGACKEPLHRKHAKLQGTSEEGYTGRAMPSNEPEYLYAERNHALYLNLIDARDMKYIPNECINKALEFIDKEMEDGRNVIIVCNKSESRSPSLALMWLIRNGYYEFFKDSRNSVHHLMSDFQGICSNYNPSNGMRDYVIKFWEEYCNE